MIPAPAPPPPPPPPPPSPESSPAAPAAAPASSPPAPPAAPGAVKGFSQASPCQPGPHAHFPFMRRPLKLQWSLHPSMPARQVGPVKPVLHWHVFDAGEQKPFGPQGGLHRPAAPMQVGPLKPATQWHLPFSQVPWPEQSGSGHVSWMEQSSPLHPASQTHSPGSSQVPCPLQQPRTLQSTPRKPEKQRQLPSMQSPLCEHSLGQKAE